MNELLERITNCIELGKIDTASPYPPDMQGQPGADELTKAALDAGITASGILDRALVKGMRNIGEKFGRNEVFIPDVLMAAKAMDAAMAHLKPHFQSGEVLRRGTLVLGTVRGDLHDIGKKLVGLIIEGGGWEIIDLGVDVPAENFINAIGQNPGCTVGLSSLLTTTMVYMGEIVEAIKTVHPETKIIVGGAPITQNFADSIGADAYSSDPQGAVEYLESLTKTV